jgi:alpha-1,3-rhamnosyl/mannosyltransferase
MIMNSEQPSSRLISADRLPLHVDGLIFGLQSHGGISRVFNNLLAAFAQRSTVSVNLYLPGELLAELVLPASIQRLSYPAPMRIRPGRVFARLNARIAKYYEKRFWRGIKNGVFLSSHYSSPEGVRVPQVQMIQDMIYERLPSLFSTPRELAHVADKLRVARCATAIICPSEWSRRDVAEYYAIDRREIRVVPYAIDDVFRLGIDQAECESFRRNYLSGEPYLLHAGSRYLHKNFTALMAAYSRWPGRKSFRLVSVGGGPLSGAELALAHGLGIQDRLTAVPRLFERDLVAAYHAAAAFVFPSLYEGYGLPVLEARACGVPVACSRASCLPEVGGSAPWYFDPADGEEMVAAIENSLNCDRRGSRITADQTQAAARTWHDVANEVFDVCRSVANK